MRTFQKLTGCVAFSTLLISAVALLGGASCAAQTQAKAVPWPASQSISPQTLARELESGKKPLIVCVGFPILYEAAHIPGARIEGPARDAAGIKQLEKWARSVSKNKRVVIYCGCCPMSHCPNIHPAYRALRRAGFTHVRVLDLEQSFASDWVNKGYPTSRAK